MLADADADVVSLAGRQACDTDTQCDFDIQSDNGTVCTECGWPRLGDALPLDHESSWERVNRASYIEVLLKGVGSACAIASKTIAVPAATATYHPAATCRPQVVRGSTSIVTGRVMLNRPSWTSVQVRMRGIRGKTLKAMTLIDEITDEGDMGYMNEEAY